MKIRILTPWSEGNTAYVIGRDYEVGDQPGQISEAAAKHAITRKRARPISDEELAAQTGALDTSTAPPAVGHTIVADDEHGGRSIFRDPREKGPDTVGFTNDVLPPNQRPVETPIVKAAPVSIPPVASVTTAQVTDLTEQAGAVGDVGKTPVEPPIPPAQPGDAVDGAGHPKAD